MPDFQALKISRKEKKFGCSLLGCASYTPTPTVTCRCHQINVKLFLSQKPANNT